MIGGQIEPVFSNTTAKIAPSTINCGTALIPVGQWEFLSEPAKEESAKADLFPNRRDQYDQKNLDCDRAEFSREIFLLRGAEHHRVKKCEGEIREKADTDPFGGIAGPELPEAEALEGLSPVDPIWKLAGDHPRDHDKTDSHA